MCCGEGAVEIKCPLCASKKSLREAADGARNALMNFLVEDFSCAVIMGTIFSAKCKSL